MTGAILGDLAAWTWEHDKETFYKRLVSENARLSENGLCMLAVFQTGWNRYDYPIFQDDFNSFMRMHYRDVVLSEEWHRFLESGCSTFTRKVSDRFYAACLILAGWEGYSDEIARRLSHSIGMDKEGLYASCFASVIWELRQGATKKDIATRMAMEDMRVDTVLRWHEYNDFGAAYGDKDILYHLNYAWRSFFYSWDFTSAIHNAMRCPDKLDRHLVGMLTGAIAESMYGCRWNYIKEKYADHGCCNSLLRFPEAVDNKFGDVLSSIYKFESENKVFFAKNDAMTNVERHHWVPFTVKGIPATITSVHHRRMMKAFDTGYECRFGVYLDDGWFYVYRSYFLLARFRMKQVQDHWKIEDMQRCADDKHDPEEGVRCLFNSIMEAWCHISDERESEELTAADVCKYYMGEKECPFEIGSPKGRFWHGEMMFVTGNLLMRDWKEAARTAALDMSPENAHKFRMYSDEHQAILIYMTNLYAKWRPYDDQEWMKDY